MLKRNTKYTAIEILYEAGFSSVVIPPETPDEKGEEILLPSVFGKFSINIGGISGIVDPNKIILIASGTEKLVVIVAGTAKEVELEDGGEEHALSDGAREAMSANVGTVETE